MKRLGPLKRLYAVRLDPDLLKAMKRVKRQIGIPESEQIRRALRKWLTTKGELRPLSEDRSGRRER